MELSIESENSEEKFIELFNGRYMISDKGRVYSIKFNRFIQPVIYKYVKNNKIYKYLNYTLCFGSSRISYRAHKLVLMAFKPELGGNTKSKNIKHLNNDTLDNRLENLNYA
jgi:hypothetical protein